MRRFTNGLILTLLILIGGCDSRGSETGTILLRDVEFNFSGPLDAGSNAAQFEWTLKPADYLRMWTETSSIKTAKLVSAEINDADEYEFDGINNLVLSLVSENEDLSMTEVAVLNPLKPKTNKQVLNLAQEAEIDDFFKEKMMYILLDAGLSEALEDNIKLTADITFEVTYD